ncbi:MAG: hypothetical protein KAG64_02965 [Bacteroidales bacterium]|nr:hypothetical protein [Bacteroidales bacterium]
MFRIFSILFVLGLLLLSCTKDNADECDDDVPEYIDTTTLISLYNGMQSHNAGTDCKKCHQKGGNGKGWFVVSGTVYDSLMQQVFPNATVYIYDGLTSADPLLATIEVDSLGNFYTTQDIDFKNGLHVEVYGKSFTAKMGSLIYAASCNKCHGVTTNRIWTK